MNIKNRKTVMTFLLLLLFTSCSGDSSADSNNLSIIQNKNISALSNQEVSLRAIGAEAYSWRQLSGVSVVLISANTSTLSFIAPEVQTQETLVFEVEVLISSSAGGNVTKKDSISVTISPIKTTLQNSETVQTVGDLDATTDSSATMDSNLTGITLNSINLSVEKTTLNKNETTTLRVVATYSDKTTKDITNEVEWITIPSDTISIENRTLKATRDIDTKIQAKLNNSLSQTIDLDIYWEADGHRLPPEPDPTINNSTLLGIDVNNNGVRDDVERWIYEEYKDKHPIHVDIAMQAGRAYKLILETPERAKEIRLKVNGALFCTSYYAFEAQFYNDQILVLENEKIDIAVKSKYFNTKERSDVYWQYDTFLSGDSYDLPKDREWKLLCDFNTSKYKE